MAMIDGLALRVPDARGDCERFLLHFRPLMGAGDLAFPCDASGRVELDSLTDRERANYLFARALCGRDYGRPRVVAR